MLRKEVKRNEKKAKKRNIKLNTTSADEHVPEIEQMIRVIKERMRAHVNRMPCKILPKIISSDFVIFLGSSTLC